MEISVASWNLCGLKGIEDDGEAFLWLTSHKVIFVEESLHTTVPNLFKNFSVVDYPARVTGGRRSGGLLLLIANDWLKDGVIEVISHERYLVGARVTFQNSSVVFCNIYSPVHSWDCPEHVETLLESRITMLGALYPGDPFVLGMFTLVSIA